MNFIILVCDDTKQFKNIKWLKLSKGYPPVSSHFIRQEPFMYVEDIMKEIKLTQGKVALVDDSDFEYLNQWKWFAAKARDTFYAHRNIRVAKGKQRTIRMHRIIMNTPEGMETDHEDHNGLNNQRYNLRNCTEMENKRNSVAQKNNKSGYVGVSLHKDTKRGRIYTYWLAQIGHRGKDRHLGYFKTPELAALAYNKKALELYGKFACLNIVDIPMT